MVKMLEGKNLFFLHLFSMIIVESARKQNTCRKSSFLVQHILACYSTFHFAPLFLTFLPYHFHIFMGKLVTIKIVLQFSYKIFILNKCVQENKGWFTIDAKMKLNLCYINSRFWLSSRSCENVCNCCAIMNLSI